LKRLSELLEIRFHQAEAKHTNFGGIWQHLPRMLSSLNKPTTARMTKNETAKKKGGERKCNKQNFFSSCFVRTVIAEVLPGYGSKNSST